MTSSDQNGREADYHFLQLPGIPFWKRLLDLSFIILTAPLLLPLMLMISILIRMVSPGPALFRQVRIGLRGREFTCLKFRTMKVNADTSVHQGHLSRLMDSNVPMKKLDGADPRVIPCGLILRTLGLDELPQIFNVLRGEMSMVGPRPCVPYEYEKYSARQRTRFNAVPGLTGLWQVSGKNRTTFDEMIRLDIQYAEHTALLLDLQIMLKTFPALLVQFLDARNKSKPAIQPVRPVAAET